MNGKILLDVMPEVGKTTTFIVVKHAPKLRYVLIGVAIGVVLATSWELKKVRVTV